MLASCKSHNLQKKTYKHHLVTQRDRLYNLEDQIKVLKEEIKLKEDQMGEDEVTIHALQKEIATTTNNFKKKNYDPNKP